MNKPQELEMIEQPDPGKRLSKQEQRYLRHPKDRNLKVDNRDLFRLLYGQTKDKIKYHGGLFSLHFRENDDGRTVTLRTEENIERFMDGIEDIIYNPNTTWIDENATFQGGTEREVKAIHAYNEDQIFLLCLIKRHVILLLFVDLPDWK